ncbi:MAG TPA: dCTP deaminase [Rhizomicrobium sp.]
MIVSNGSILARLKDLRIEASNPNFPFRPEAQIQPCSIDLRLGDVFWIPRRFHRVDLSDNTPLGPQITSSFKKIHCSSPSGYLLRPGRFILGRTYERFAIPNDLCGRLIGRSSMGRLGVLVSGAANFINPGWSGHMPVAIVNQSPFSIRIHPYLSIVQLCLFQLEMEVKNPYGSAALGSKYIDDDGGPSKYWLDQTITEVRQNLRLRNSSERAEHFLEVYSKELDDPTRKRLLRKIRKSGYIDDPTDFIAAFISSEARRQGAMILLGLLVSTLISILVAWLPSFVTSGAKGTFLSVALAVITFLLSAWFYWAQFGTTYSPSELRRISSELRKSPS